MIDLELVKILRQGSKVWNRWRKQHPEALEINLYRVDLREIDLREANLYGADLREVDLSGSDLSGSDLNVADLRKANLHEANLREANLRDADLRETNLNRVNLRRANLRNADLREASLSHADLSGANLNSVNLVFVNLHDTNLERTDWINATIGWTQFGNIDLRQVAGLKTVRHNGPSTIGLDTIYRSHGQIPEAFLRGAGVPETFITNMRSLVASTLPIDYYTCFIAYSHHNEDFAKRLHADLQARGVRCWFAEEDLKIGDHYHQRIDDAIRLYEKLILVLSETAVNSTWVKREVAAACEKEEHQRREVLFPIRLDNAVMETSQAWAADVRRRWHIGDFTHWKDHDQYQIAFDRLLRDLKAQK